MPPRREINTQPHTSHKMSYKKRRHNHNPQRYKDKAEEYIKNRERLEKVIAKIINKMREGDYFYAIKKADELIEKYNSIRAKLIKVKALGLVGNVNKAEELAVELEKTMYPNKRGKLYTTLIQIYNETGDIEKIRSLERKIISNHLLDGKAATSIIKAYAACHSKEDMERFFNIVKEKGIVDPHIITTLIDGYARMKMFDKAVDVFNEYPLMRTVAVYTSLIKAMLRWGSKEAKELATKVFEEAKRTKEIDEKLYHTYIHLMKDNIELCKALYEEGRRLLSDGSKLKRSMLKVYLENGMLDKAESIYYEMRKLRTADLKDSFIMLEAYTRARNVPKAEKIFNHIRYMTERTNKPKPVTMDAYQLMFEMYLEVANFENAKAIADLFISKYGYMSKIINAFVRTSIKHPEIHEYIKKLFNEMEDKGLTTPIIRSNMIAIFGEMGDIEKAEEIFKRLEKEGYTSPYMYGNMASAYVSNKKYKKAFSIIKKAKEKNIPLGSILPMEIRIYGEIGDKKALDNIFESIKRMGKVAPPTLNELMRAYTLIKDRKGANAVFRYMKSNGLCDERAYTMLMKVYGEYGDIRKVKSIFGEAMKARKFDKVTYSVFFDILYMRGFYEDISTYYNNAPKWIREIPSMVLRYANAKRKMGERNTAVAIVDRLLKGYKPQLYTDAIFVYALVTKAYALKDIGERIEAKHIFEGIIRYTNEDNPIYPTALVGYAFTLDRKDESIIDINELRRKLKSFIKDGKGREEDIIHALEKLKSLK